jgi:hypothetical protein
MWHLWILPADSSEQDKLTFIRWIFVIYSIAGLSMAFVLVRTYKHSKYPYLYTCAATMFVSALFTLLANVLYNWASFCP